MKVMVIVRATKNSEAGILPDEKLLTEMGTERLDPQSRADSTERDQLQPYPFSPVTPPASSSSAPSSSSV